MLLKYLSLGESIRIISERLDRSPSTISRELKRNQMNTSNYSPSKAQENSRNNKKKCGRKRKLDWKILQSIVESKINLQWSPEEIDFRLSRERGQTVVSYNTIYRSIYRGEFNVGNRLGRKNIAKQLLQIEGKNLVIINS